MIAVVGAGPTGLAAAWRAARAGHEVVVLERAPTVGGMAASFDVAGLRVDHGSHRLHPSTAPAILTALRELLGDDLQTRPRHGRIRLQDRWVAFPLRAASLLRQAPPAFALRAGRDTIIRPVHRARQRLEHSWRAPAARQRLRAGGASRLSDDRPAIGRHSGGHVAQEETFADVVRDGLGPTVLDSFYGPYARKLWDTEPDELAGELARRRISSSSPVDIARRLARGRRNGGPTFLYPRTGFGAISEALADAAVTAGADLRLSCGVRRLTAVGGWRLELDGGGRLDVAQVWSTAPLAALAGAIEPPPPPAVAAAAGRLRHRAMVLLYLVLDRPQWTPFDAHYFPGPEVMASRLSEPRNYRDNPDDPPDRTVLCAEIPCWQGDETWRASDGVLAERLVAELGRLGSPPVEPVHVDSLRLLLSYPI